MHRQSSMCHECYLSLKARPDNYIDKTCPVCGKAFAVHISQTKRGQGKYCSRSCARSGSPTRKKSTPIVSCSTCGKKFNKYKAEIRKNRGSKHFCSPDCWYAYNQRDNHYLWAGGQDGRMNPDGIKWRKKVLARDQHFCRICHANKKLEAHHIKPFGKHPELRWDVSNGVTLCHDCHTKFRNREEEYIEILSFIASVPVKVWHVST